MRLTSYIRSDSCSNMKHESRPDIPRRRNKGRYREEWMIARHKAIIDRYRKQYSFSKRDKCTKINSTLSIKIYYIIIYL